MGESRADRDQRLSFTAGEEIFRSLLRRSGRAVKVLARTLEGYRVPPWSVRRWTPAICC